MPSCATRPIWGRYSSFSKRAGQLAGRGARTLFLRAGHPQPRHAVGDIPAISDGAQRLAQGIASLLYAEDVDSHYQNLQAYAEPELTGDEWTPSEPTAQERRGAGQ